MTRQTKPRAKLHLLTVREVQTVSTGDYSDGGGLTLRVRGESASWVLRYTATTGRRREMGLGVAHRGSAKQAGESLTGARDLAHAAREQIRQGVDPIDSRDDRREADKAADVKKKVAKARSLLTLARAARDYHERVVEPRLTSKHAAQWISSLENHMPPAIWHAPIASIDAPSLLTVLAGVRSMEQPGLRVPETLQRVRQRLDAVFEDAIFHGHCATNPAAALRRKMRETLPAKPAGRFAALPYPEITTFIGVLQGAVGTAARCLEFAALTASRTNEVLLASWSEFDLDAGVWTIPGERMKAGEDHTVYLNERALAILAAQRGIDETYVFPSTMLEGKPMSNMAMLKVLTRLGYRERTTVHGLCRATFSTWANDTAAARPDVIEACLAHREADKVKAAYNRALFSNERRALMDAWGRFVAPSHGEVIELRAA